MTPNHINDVKHWRDRAAEMRAISDTMKDDQALSSMLRLADDYDLLADRAQLRANGEVPPQGSDRECFAT